MADFDYDRCMNEDSGRCEVGEKSCPGGTPCNWYEVLCIGHYGDYVWTVRAGGCVPCTHEVGVVRNIRPKLPEKLVLKMERYEYRKLLKGQFFANAQVVQENQWLSSQNPCFVYILAAVNRVGNVPADLEVPDDE